VDREKSAVSERERGAKRYPSRKAGGNCGISKEREFNMTREGRGTGVVESRQNAVRVTFGERKRELRKEASE